VQVCAQDGYSNHPWPQTHCSLPQKQDRWPAADQAGRCRRFRQDLHSGL